MEEDEDNKEKKMKIGIFVGSQTGTAQEFAETLESEGNDAGFDCTVVDLEEFEPDMFMDYGRIIFCVATYVTPSPHERHHTPLTHTHQPQQVR